MQSLSMLQSALYYYFVSSSPSLSSTYSAAPAVLYQWPPVAQPAAQISPAVELTFPVRPEAPPSHTSPAPECAAVAARLSYTAS